MTVADSADPADSASGIAAGMLAPVFESLLDPVAPPFPLLMAARDLWPPLASLLDLSLDRRGALGIAPTGERDSWVERLQALGAGFRLTDPLRHGVPWLVTDRPGVWTYEDWRLSPPHALAALRAAAESAGARWRRAAVERFEPGRAVLSDGDILSCDALIVATGASKALSGVAGEMQHITPVKGQIMRWPSVALDGPVVRLRGAYICPAREGVMVGATMEPGRDDLRIDPSALAGVRGKALAVVPALEAGAMEVRVGVRAATPDGLPLVGRSSFPGAWLAVGARRNGWLLAPLLARIIADMLEGATPNEYAALFDPERFLR